MVEMIIILYYHIILYYYYIILYYIILYLYYYIIYYYTIMTIFSQCKSDWVKGTCHVIIGNNDMVQLFSKDLG